MFVSPLRILDWMCWTIRTPTLIQLLYAENEWGQFFWHQGDIWGTMMWLSRSIAVGSWISCTSWTQKHMRTSFLVSSFQVWGDNITMKTAVRYSTCRGLNPFSFCFLVPRNIVWQPSNFHKHHYSERHHAYLSFITPPYSSPDAWRPLRGLCFLDLKESFVMIFVG